MNENEFNLQLLQKQNELDNLNNILNNERQNNSAQIQQKQNELDQMRISFEGERNNFNSQLQQKQNELDNLNNILNNERQNSSTQLQQKQNEIDQIRTSFDAERNNFNTQIQQKQGEVENLNNTLNNERQSNSTQQQQKQNEIDQIRTSSESEKLVLLEEKNSLSGEIRDCKNNISLLEKELDVTRLSKNEEIIKNLSIEYEKISECELKNDKEKWLSKVNESFLFIVFAVVITVAIFIFADKIDIAKKIPILSMDIVALSFLWFCINQYSYYSKLYTEYNNRKIVARSFLGVLNNVKDQNIIDESTKTVVNTLFSRSSTEIGSELPIKEVVKIVSSVASKK